MAFYSASNRKPPRGVKQVGEAWFVTPEARSGRTLVRGSRGLSWNRSTWRPLWQSGRDSGDLGAGDNTGNGMQHGRCPEAGWISPQAAGVWGVEGASAQRGVGGRPGGGAWWGTAGIQAFCLDP